MQEPLQIMKLLCCTCFCTDDSTRVVLESEESEEMSDYVNASYLSVSSHIGESIMCVYIYVLGANRQVDLPIDHKRLQIKRSALQFPPPVMRRSVRQNSHSNDGSVKSAVMGKWWRET